MLISMYLLKYRYIRKKAIQFCKAESFVSTKTAKGDKIFEVTYQCNNEEKLGGTKVFIFVCTLMQIMLYFVIFST